MNDWFYGMPEFIVEHGFDCASVSNLTLTGHLWLYVKLHFGYTYSLKTLPVGVKQLWSLLEFQNLS